VKFFTLAAVLAALLPLSATNAQEDMQSPQKGRGLALVVTTDKSVYHLGESVQIKFELKNESSRPVYIPKEWGRAGDGVPGFSEYVKQLRGPKSTRTCDPTAVSQRIRSREKPERLLEVFYLLLDQNQSVAYQMQAAGCETATAGQYRVQAEYLPWIGLSPKVEFPKLKYPVANTKVVAESASFEVIENPRQ
jgi:hypothetical protein